MYWATASADKVTTRHVLPALGENVPFYRRHSWSSERGNAWNQLWPLLINCLPEFTSFPAHSDFRCGCSYYHCFTSEEMEVQGHIARSWDWSPWFCWGPSQVDQVSSTVPTGSPENMPSGIWSFLWEHRNTQLACAKNSPLWRDSY